MLTGKRNKSSLFYPPYSIPPRRGRWGWGTEESRRWKNSFTSVIQIQNLEHLEFALCKSVLLVILSHLEYKGILLESFWFLHTWIHICHHSSDCLGKETSPATDYEKAERVKFSAVIRFTLQQRRCVVCGLICKELQSRW